MTARRTKTKSKSTRTPRQKADTAEWLINLLMAMPESLDNELASDWLERKMIITEGPFPGPYTFARSPYLREIVDNLSIRSDTIETVLIKANQIGASMCSFGVMAYYIDKGIGPQLFVSGDATMAEEAFSKRLDPIIESAGLRPKIRAVVKKEKATSSATGDTKSVKSYGGTFIRAVGPNSEGKLRSFPSQINYIEELSVFPQLLKGKGNPIEKIVRRADSFGPLRRIYYNSTPKEKTTSQVLPLMEAGDWRKYMWHCPKCGKQQPFEFSGFQWDKTESGSPKIDIDERGRVTNDPVWYECQNEECKHKIVNGDKYKLLLDYKSGGTAEWVPTKKPERPGIRSYQLNAFYGFRTWLDIVLQYERVKDDPILYPDFVNDVLAECSEARVATPEPNVLMSRREEWSTADTTIPGGVAFIVITCDVQGDRLEASLVGFGQNVQSWVLNYWTLPGDTADPSNICWENLASKIEAEYMREDGTTLRPIVSFVDAGFRTDSVRAFCAQYSHAPGVIDGVYPVFGRDDYVAKGRNYKIMPTDNGTPEVMINDQHFKRLVYAYIERENEYKRGYIHFPKDFGEEYFKGLTAEDMIETTTATGKTVYKIMNNKKRRNEPLDLQKMAYAVLYFMCGEYYGAINKRRRASKKTEVPPDLDEFIKIMMPEGGESMQAKYTNNLDEYKKKLARAGISIQTAGVEAINHAAYNLYAEYRRRLIAETALKSRDFTLAAPRVFPARHPVKGKAPRKLADINAKLIVPTMKGDKEHYLYQLETGATRKGDSRAGNRVPIPLDSSRTGGARSAKVAGQYQMQKQFAYGGAIDLSIYAGEKARQGAILNDMGRRGKIAKNTYYTVDMGDAKYLARITGKKVSLLRNMNETQTKTPPEPLFEETTKTMTQAQMDYWFIQAVEKEMQKLS